MKLGARLKKYRELIKCSQSDISKKTHIPQTTISDWELSKSEPNASDLLKLSNALGVDVTTLLGVKDSKTA